MAVGAGGRSSGSEQRWNERDHKSNGEEVSGYNGRDVQLNEYDWMSLATLLRASKVIVPKMAGTTWAPSLS